MRLVCGVDGSIDALICADLRHVSGTAKVNVDVGHGARIVDIRQGFTRAMRASPEMRGT
ncbi:hypothetical protein [Corynebacterium kroppenstedtii]|uniref:hypothetical protein n=1 Tax=Corynebacterium kroppenstedtii TaxID=161879 RepID=UPI00269917B9|nr:hypothetical protein [Corynebacterium kroppenstedtii]